MNWICIGMIAGSLITSAHDTKEACEGRAFTLREMKATVKCVDMTHGYSTSGNVLMFNQCRYADGSPCK